MSAEHKIGVSEAHIARRRDLLARAEAYLRSARIISEPGANLSRLIERYVAGERWDEPELGNQLAHDIRIAQSEAACRNEAGTGAESDARRFYEGTAAILLDIQKEVFAGRV